ncbi:MAG: hypothetical protein ACREL5_10200 [Gemmatimonadales bacterium]
MRTALTLAAGVIWFIPSTVAAQATPVGTVVIAMHVTPGASTGAGMLGTVGLRFTAASDGQRSAVTISFDSLGGSAAMLQGAWLRVISRRGADSADILVSLTPALRMMIPPAITGGDSSLGVSLRIGTHAADSVIQNDTLVKDSTHATPTGRYRTVAGMRCEDWRVVSGTDSGLVCMAQQSTATEPLVGWARERLHISGPRADRLSQIFRGQKLIPLRAEKDSQLVVEVVSATSAAPAADVFAIPAGFHPLDTQALKAMIPPGMIPKKP